MSHNRFDPFFELTENFKYEKNVNDIIKIFRLGILREEITPQLFELICLGLKDFKKKGSLEQLNKIYIQN
jgi:hypothetical protein